MYSRLNQRKSDHDMMKLDSPNESIPIVNRISTRIIPEAVT